MSADQPDIPIETLAQTDDYTLWSAEEPDGETTYHLELGPVTAHFFNEEWDEFVKLIRKASQEIADDEDVELEQDWGTLYFTREEWEEFLALLAQV